MELLSITLAANETKQFAKAGRYFEIIESAFPITVNFYSASGAQSDSMVNALSGLFLEDPYVHFSISNGATAQTVILLLMEIGRGGSRRQPGTVRVIDQGADKTATGNQFLLVFSQASGAGGSIVAIKANTKKVFVKSLMVGSDTAGTLEIFMGTAAPTANPSVPPAGRNKRLFGAAADHSVAYGTCATLPVTGGEVPGASVIGYVSIQANATQLIPLTTPIEIDPGGFLLVASGAINKSVSVIADIEET